MIKALFVGSLSNPSASGCQRSWALKACGVEVVEVDTTRFAPIGKRWAHTAARLMRQPRWTIDATRLEAAIASDCERHQPQMVWIEWPRTFQKGFISALRASSSRPIAVSFQDDNPFGDRHSDRWQWSGYFRSAKEFDLHLIKRASDAHHLAALGAKRTRLWSHGVYTPLYHSLPTDKRYTVSFVGTCMDDRPQFIEALLMAGLPIHVFGTRWETRSSLPSRFPEFFHGPVYGEEYADVLRASSLAIGLVSHSNRDEWSMRTYEVPACGSTLVAERTATHTEWFEEDREALFFKDTKECVEKIRWAIAHPERCAAIGAASLRKCASSNWALDRRMADLIAELLPDSSHFIE